MQDTSPNWFDWLTFIVSIVSILGGIAGGYWISRSIYLKEIKGKQIEEINLIDTESKLFLNNINHLNTNIEIQIGYIEDYIANKDFNLKFNSNLQINFIQFVGVKYLYLKVGLDRKEKIDEVNNLLSSLYSLEGLKNSLTNSLTNYIKRYNELERTFYKYRSLFYTKYFELWHSRDTEFTIVNGVKNAKINEDDLYLKEYRDLLQGTFSNQAIISNNGLQSRELLVSEFIIPLIKLSNKFIPEDPNAIEINEIANEINSSFKDMEKLTENHFQMVDSYIEVLKKAHSSTQNFSI